VPVTLQGREKNRMFQFKILRPIKLISIVQKYRHTVLFAIEINIKNPPIFFFRKYKFQACSLDQTKNKLNEPQVETESVKADNTLQSI